MKGVAFDNAREQNGQSHHGSSQRIDNNGFVRQFSVEITNSFVINVFTVIVFIGFFDRAESYYISSSK